jgi:hypothetical protein
MDVEEPMAAAFEASSSGSSESDDDEDTVEVVESREAAGGAEPVGGDGKRSRGKRDERLTDKKRTRLSLQQKAEVLEMLKNKRKQAVIAEHFNVGERTVQRIKKEAAKIKEDLVAGGVHASKAKSAHKSRVPEVEAAVLALFEEARRCRLPVTRDTLRAFGIKAAKDLLAAPSCPAERKKLLEDFTASKSWVKKFVKRNNLSSKLLHGEAGSVDGAATAEGMAKLRDTCKKYRAENIFNVDETGLFYRLLPRRTLNVSQGRLCGVPRV